MREGLKTLAFLYLPSLSLLDQLIVVSSSVARRNLCWPLSLSSADRSLSVHKTAATVSKCRAIYEPKSRALCPGFDELVVQVFP